MMKTLNTVLLLVFVTSMGFAAGGQDTEAASAGGAPVEYALEQIGPLNGNPLSDIRVRQAIAYAVDMDAICESLFEGKAIPADSLIENGPWKAEGLDPYGYNPERAKALLSAAGWDPDYELDVVYYYGDQLTVDLMTVIQAYLAEVGVKMTFRRVVGDIASQLWTAPADKEAGPTEVEWDIAYGAIAAAVLGDFFGRFYSHSANNSHTPRDPQYDALVEATRESADMAKQMAAYHELSEYYNKSLYGLPLYYQQIFIAESERVNRNGVPYGNEQYAYDWRIIDWDVKADNNGERVLHVSTGPVEFFQYTFINPSLAMSNKLLFDRLIIANGSLVPTRGQLAEDYTLSDDGMTLNMILRDDVKWHDGRPFTAEDVKFTIEYTLQVPGVNPVVENTYSSIEGAEEFKKGTAPSVRGVVVDGNRITIRFAKLDPDALFTFSQWPPLPKHLLEDTDPMKAQQNSFWQSPVGTGPFMLDEVNMNDYTVLKSFEGYWDQSGIGNIDTIFMSPSAPDADPNLVVNAEAGKIDYAYSKVVADVNAIEKMDHMNVTPVDIRYTRLFYFNKFEKKQ